MDLLLNGLQQGTLGSIDNFVLLLLGIVVALNLFTFIQRYMFNKMNELTIGNLRKELYKRYLRYPVSFYDKERIGELLSRINTDIAMVQYIFCEQIPTFIYQTVVMVVAITIMFFVSVKLTLITLVTFPVAILLSIIIGKRVRRISKSIQDSFAKSFIYVEETLQKIRTVKIFGNEAREQKEHEVLLDKIVNDSVKKGVYTTSLDSLGAMITSVVMVFIFWYGTSLLKTDEATIGSLVTFFFTSFLLGESISKISSAYGNLQNSISVVGRLKWLMEVKKEPNQGNNDIPVSFDKTIAFKNCSFSYSEDRDETVLESLDLTIHKGMKIGIVGPSGAGKSTLIQLILRFYEPTSGSILLDDTPISELPLQAYRDIFGVVSQEIELFGGTIKSNIAYSVRDCDMDEIIDAAKKANAYEFIQKLPKGFDTVVGENGIMLSGGQRQRIAIARALLKNPDILLLDEATSSVDSGTETLIKEALERLMVNRTAIIVAHRLDTIRDADKILVFDKGKIVESGSEQELLNLEGGLYQKLIKQQQPTINV